MSVTIQIDLPKALVDEARANGLLDSASMGALLAGELRRRRAGTDLANVLQRVRASPGEPMAVGDVSAEVKAAREERRARETGH